MGHREEFFGDIKPPVRLKEFVAMQDERYEYYPKRISHKEWILKNALKDPLNPAYIVFATNYIKNFDASKQHYEMKEYLDVALRLAIHDPFFATSEKVLKLWLDFNEKIGNTQQSISILKCFERNKVLGLKNYPNVNSLFPLEIIVSGDRYVLMTQDYATQQSLVFQGRAIDNVQQLLEFRLYYSQKDYLVDFDAFRMNSQLKDYDIKIGLLVIESLASDPNILLNFRSYTNIILDNFISNYKQNVLRARMSPLDLKSQMFMHNYIEIAENMTFTKEQCKVVINSFLNDLIEASVNDPLSPYNEKCIQNWMNTYIGYYSEGETGYILQKFYSMKLDFIRFSQTNHISNRLPIEIIISKMNFIISEELGRGANGVAFNGYPKGVSQVQLVIKLIFSKKINARESFYNEITALSKLKRLIAYDASMMVICQKKIAGVPLDTVLNSCSLGSELEKTLSRNYISLCQNLFDNYGLIHGDIRPENVIIDLNHNLQLIDFGMTKSASTFGPAAASKLENDIQKASNEYKCFFARKEAYRALDNADDSRYQQHILEYIDLLRKTNRVNDLRIWSNFYNQKFCSLTKSDSI